MRSIEVTFPSGSINLAGTLTTPDSGAAPAVVLCIHGSGPADRDENAGPHKINAFNTMAAALAGRGIACLRYDKRGCGKSGGDYYAAGQGDLFADAVAALDFLRTAAPVTFDRHVLLGHSEGTVIAPQVLAARRGGVDGLVLLNPFVEDMEAVLGAQARMADDLVRTMGGFNGALARFVTRIAGSPTTTQRRLLDKVRSTDRRVIRVFGQRVPALWMRDLLALDPPALYGAVDVPTLVLGGGKDLQCNPADTPRIGEIIGEPATVVVLPDLTHILRKDPQAHTLLRYKPLLKQPVDPEVLAIVGDWVAARFGRN